MIDFEEYERIIMPERTYQSIEQIVVNLYKDLNIKTLTFDVIDIARKKGYKVGPYSKLGNKKRKWLILNGYDAINFFDTDRDCFVIWYDDSKNLKRQRFSIMHEIGHILLGHKQESALAKIQANYFAAYSLAPNPLIHLCQIEDYIELAERFNISEECAHHCAARYNRWLQYGNKKFLPYEDELMQLFEAV